MTAKERYEQLKVILGHLDARVHDPDFETTRRLPFPMLRTMLWARLSLEGYSESEIARGVGKNHSTINIKLGNFYPNKDELKLYNDMCKYADGKVTQDEQLHRAIVKQGWKLTDDITKRNAILRAINRNNGHCPCANKYKGTDDDICPCKAYREEDCCCCGLYVKEE